MTTIVERLDIAVHSEATLRGFRVEPELPDGTAVPAGSQAWHLTRPIKRDGRSGILHAVLTIDVAGQTIMDDEAWDVVEYAFEHRDGQPIEDRIEFNVELPPLDA